jgi:hypothetical protein
MTPSACWRPDSDVFFRFILQKWQRGWGVIECRAVVDGKERKVDASEEVEIEVELGVDCNEGG